MTHSWGSKTAVSYNEWFTPIGVYIIPPNDCLLPQSSNCSRWWLKYINGRRITTTAHSLLVGSSLLLLWNLKAGPEWMYRNHIAKVDKKKLSNHEYQNFWKAGWTKLLQLATWHTQAQHISATAGSFPRESDSRTGTMISPLGIFLIFNACSGERVATAVTSPDKRVGTNVRLTLALICERSTIYNICYSFFALPWTVFLKLTFNDLQRGMLVSGTIKDNNTRVAVSITGEARHHTMINGKRLPHMIWLIVMTSESIHINDDLLPWLLHRHAHLDSTIWLP